MNNTLKKPRVIKMDDAMWDGVKAAAEKAGVSASEFVRRKVEAAPDLLEALRNARHYVATFLAAAVKEGPVEVVPVVTAELAAIDAAIAKATGGES